MASNKKPSMYSERGTIGSAEELEAYGVWVKSEPQDFTASLAEAAANFNAEALPYEADFDTSGFDHMGGAAGFDLLEPELNIPEVSVEDDEFINREQGGEETSTRLLTKIAGELSSIRAELNTLKKEFAEIRGEAGAEGAGEEAKDALAGDAMDNFFTSADFPVEEGLGFDPGREADEAALKELDAQNEAEEEIHIDFDNLGIDLDGAEAAAETEAITEEETQQELPSLEAVTDDDEFEMPSFDTLSFEEAPADEASASEQDEPEEEAQGFAEELVPLEEEEDKELQALRLEGAESLAPPPENADYLETDPFADTGLNTVPEEETLSEDLVQEPEQEPVDESGLLEDAFGDAIPEEPAQPETEAAEEPAAETEASETTVSETAASEATSSETTDITFDELSFDETSFDLGLDDFSAEPSPAPVEEEKEEEKIEPLPDDGALDLSDAVIDEPNLSEEIVEPPLEEPVLSDISFEDDMSLEMDGFETELEDKPEEPAADLEPDVKAEELPSDLDLELAAKADELPSEPDLELATEMEEQPPEPDFELPAETEELPAEPDLELPAETEELPAEPDFELPAETEELPAEPDIELPVETEEQPPEPDFELPAETEEQPAEPDIELSTEMEEQPPEPDLELPVETEEQPSEPDIELPAETEEQTSDPDLELVAEAVELPSDLDFELDQAGDLAVVDLEADLESTIAEPKDTEKAAGKPDRAPAAPANDIISDVDDSIIPEGFEVNAKEADPSLDDDLEAFAGELSIAGDESPSDSADKLADDSGEFAAIPPGLKNELKNVLSYMDRLLESLPEEKIEEFAQSEYFGKYKKIFKELGLV